MKWQKRKPVLTLVYKRDAASLYSPRLILWRDLTTLTIISKSLFLQSTFYRIKKMPTEHPNLGNLELKTT